jgi:hypothetical protein
MKILDIPQPGKKGLDVSMNGRYGQASRTLVIPTNPRAASQMTIRANLSAVAKRWRTLTENQRQAWNSTGNTYSPWGECRMKNAERRMAGGKAAQSHIKATPKPVDSQGIATPKPP